MSATALSSFGRTAPRVALKVLLYGLLAFAIGFTILPVIYAVSLSLRVGPDVLKVPPTLWPPHPTIRAYLGMSQSVNVARAILNTAIVAGATTLIAVSFASLAAYAFARLHFRYANQLMVLLLVSQMFPGASVIVPLFRFLRELGLYNIRAYFDAAHELSARMRP